MTRTRHYGPWLAVLSIALLVSACGIKPGKLDAPEGSGKDEFPHTYPAPETR